MAVFREAGLLEDGEFVFKYCGFGVQMETTASDKRKAIGKASRIDKAKQSYQEPPNMPIFAIVQL